MPEADANFFGRHMPRWGSQTSVNFFVDTEGRVLECDIVYPQMSEEREADLCENTLGKRLGRPAQDSQSQPAHGVIRLTSKASRA